MGLLFVASQPCNRCSMAGLRLRCCSAQRSCQSPASRQVATPLSDLMNLMPSSHGQLHDDCKARHSFQALGPVMPSTCSLSQTRDSRKKPSFSGMSCQKVDAQIRQSGKQSLCQGITSSFQRRARGDEGIGFQSDHCAGATLNSANLAWASQFDQSEPCRRFCRKESSRLRVIRFFKRLLALSESSKPTASYPTPTTTLKIQKPSTPYTWLLESSNKLMARVLPRHTLPKTAALASAFPARNFYFGLAIGFAVLAGGVCAANISGGSPDPRPHGKDRKEPDCTALRLP